MLQLINDKQPKSIPKDLLSLGSSIKTTTQPVQRRKRSILGKKMFNQTLSATPRSKISGINIVGFGKQQSDMKDLFDKSKSYVSKLDELLNGKQVKYGVNWSKRQSVSYKDLGKSGKQYNDHFKTLSDDWISCMNRIDSKISQINYDQRTFYETTKDEFRSYLDLNREEIEADSAENPTEDDSQVPESECMQDRNQFRMNKIPKAIPKPKNRFKTFDRLFQRDNPKTVTKFQKQAKIIKDFNRQEYDNRMFEEVFNAVNQPQTLLIRKAQIESMLEVQNQKLKKFLSSDRSMTSRSRQFGIDKNRTSPNNSIMKKRRGLKSARDERSRMNK